MKPENGEGPTVGAVAPREQTTADSSIVPDLDAGRKAYLTVQAEAALFGLRVERVITRSGRSAYILIRGGRAIDCADLPAVRSAMVRMGCKP